MATTTKPPIVPFIRVIKLDVVGYDVKFVKRALSRAGYIEWGEFSNVAGEYFEKNLNRFKRAKGLKQNGVYDFPTHEALRKSHRQNSRTEWAFDSFSIAGLTNEKITPLESVIQKTIDAVDWAIRNRDKIGYLQQRPMYDYAPYPNLDEQMDCSEFAGKWAPRSGGWLQDPNYPVGSSHKWDAYGFTGTLWDNGEPVNGLANARLCDLVFHGIPWESGGRAHVTILRQFYQGQWYAGSHGSSTGPLNVPADYRKIVGIRRYKLV